MSQIALQVNNVNKTYPSLKAVDKLDFHVVVGECFGLLGPNGAGKSTMMKMIYGKARRDKQEGEISVFGYDPRRSELQIKYLSGIVPQDNNLDLELSVVQNLLIYANFYGIPKKRAVKRINELLEFMELSQKRDATIRQLSGE